MKSAQSAEAAARRRALVLLAGVVLAGAGCEPRPKSPSDPARTPPKPQTAEPAARG